MRVRNCYYASLWCVFNVEIFKNDDENIICIGDTSTYTYISVFAYKYFSSLRGY